MTSAITTTQVVDFIKPKIKISGKNLVCALAEKYKCSLQEARFAIQNTLDAGRIRLGDQMQIEATPEKKAYS